MIDGMIPVADSASTRKVRRSRGGESWLGIDVGTSSVKSLVLDDAGVVRGRGRAQYETAFGPDGRAEQRAEGYLEALKDAIAQCGDAACQVSGIGLGGQTPTCVLIDESGQPVRPALTWQDTRARAEARELAECFGDPALIVGTSLPWDASYPPSKLLWLARNEPDAVERTRWVLQPKDFLVATLSGQVASDPWSSKGLVNVATRKPAAELLAYTGWPIEVVPPVSDAWAEVGAVSAEAAAEYGLPSDVPVTVGWSDALTGMLAAGAFLRPSAFILTGTSDIVGYSHDDGVVGGNGLFAIPTTCAPLPVAYGPTQSSGASIMWLAEMVGGDPDQLVELAERSLGDRLPVFVPYIAGERAPVWNSDARGALLGLAAQHSLGDLARAVLLGVSMTARHVFEMAGEGQALPETIVIGGRSATAPAWLSARLEALGRPLQVLAEPDVSSLGAALLAALQAGRDLAELASLRGRLLEVEPTPAQIASSREAYERYRAASDVTLAWAS
jgi:xylulokinase